MYRPRPDLLRGLAVLGVFIVFVVSIDMLMPSSIPHSGYTVIDIERAEMNPLPLEGLPVSSRTTIVAVENMGTYYIAEIEAETHLIFSSAIGHPEPGDHILLRGTCWIYSNGSITVHEFNVLDYSVSIIRSVPGILVFAVLFFMVFKVDFSRLAFVERRSE